jgi:hypothetical protein
MAVRLPDLGQLVRAIDRDHSGSAAGEGLKSAAGIAADLRGLGDQVLDHYVRAARDEGRSWTEIGDALGVTKQGAQQRFAPASVPPAQPWPSGFSASAQAVVASGVDGARALAHQYVGTEHLLLGLFSPEAGVAARTLAKLGLSHVNVEQHIEAIVGRGESVGDGALSVTPRAKRVFEAARREARRVGHQCPEPEDILLALSSMTKGVAAEILQDAGVSETSLREALAGFLEADSPERAERVRRPRRRGLSRR